jgi:hypothetical protein
MRDRELVEAITRARHATHSELRELIVSAEAAEVYRRGPLATAQVKLRASRKVLPRPGRPWIV